MHTIMEFARNTLAHFNNIVFYSFAYSHHISLNVCKIYLLKCNLSKRFDVFKSLRRQAFTINVTPRLIYSFYKFGINVRYIRAINEENVPQDKKIYLNILFGKAKFVKQGLIRRNNILNTYFAICKR